LSKLKALRAHSKNKQLLDPWLALSRAILMEAVKESMSTDPLVRFDASIFLLNSGSFYMGNGIDDSDIFVDFIKETMCDVAQIANEQEA